jgi:hypothetical protein
VPVRTRFRLRGRDAATGRNSGTAVTVPVDRPKVNVPSAWLYAKRALREAEHCEYYRCYARAGESELSARAQRFGKPFMVYEGLDTGPPVIGIQGAKNYLVNGRTEIRELAGEKVLGSYTRLNAVLDGGGERIGRWYDARSWIEEFKDNFFDALLNAALGSGETAIGSSVGDIHVLSQGKTVFASLHRQRLEFFPDPPKAESPGRLAKIAGRIIPGELGRSVRENLPPFGWALYLAGDLPQPLTRRFLLCTAILRLEMMRFSRSA